jgi:hypothetical protein
MITMLRIARHAAAIIALAATAAFNTADANHYILPCPPDCREVPIGPGMTGTWFVPGQSGHGLMIQVLPGESPQMLVSWFVFGPQGGQSWIVGSGPIAGTRAVVQAFQPAGPGGRFPPNFNAANVQQQPWGTLTFAFSDCKHGGVEWVSTVSGYGSGSMPLERLTLPTGLTCDVAGAGRAFDADDEPR